MGMPTTSPYPKTREHLATAVQEPDFWQKMRAPTKYLNYFAQDSPSIFH
jgi:hypothetical protein